MRQRVAELWDEFEDDDYLSEIEPAPGDDAGGRPPVTFGPGALLGITAYLALDADLTADPSTWVLTQIPSHLIRYTAGVTASTGRGNDNDRVGPGSGSLVLDNRDGRFTRRNPLSPYYPYLTRNTPLIVEVNAGNWAYRFLEQFVNEWPVGFDTSATDFWVTIRTGGILRRLQQNSTTLKSATYRATMGDPDLVQYWPCEDGPNAQTFASALGVGTPLAAIGTVTPSASGSESNVGTDALPTLGTGTTYLKGTTGMASTQAWTLFASYYFTSPPVWTPGDGSSYLLYVSANPAGSLARFIVYWDFADDTFYCERRTSAGVVNTIAGPTLTAAEMVDCWLTFWVSVEQRGADVDHGFGVERTTDTGTSSQLAWTTINSETVYQVEDMLMFNGKSANDTVVGHCGVVSRPILFEGAETPYYGALNGHVGEAAVDRITRLCAEERVSLTVQPSTAGSATMGPQLSASLLDNLRNAEAADGGVLYERGFGLGFQPVSARYNLRPSLRLDFQNGDINGVPRVTDDDLDLKNQWTVTRVDGSSHTFRDTESIDREGLREDAKTLPLETDDQTAQVAAWLVHVGTNPDERWPGLPVRMDSEAGRHLIEQWTSMEYGQMVSVANVPSAVSGAVGDVQVIREGHTERVDQFTWTVDMSTSPARPYRVFEVESDDYGRLDTDGSTLTAAIDSTETSLSVATTNSASPVWTTSADDLPFDIEVGGEQMRVTAVSGASSPQTFTVTRSVNGVLKSHEVGADVRVWDAAVLAL